MDEIYFSVYDGVNIVLNIFRIRGDNRTVVMVVGLFKFIPLIRDAWIEDPLYALVDQPLYMAVGKFRRIAFRFAWNRLNSQFIDLPGGSRREYHAKSQSMEESKPERVIFIHIQYPGNADGSPGSF